tara:strand:- start:569 stop:1597 length:1029 start_codon:yes stop_codon:yes gene_type:complete
MEKAILEQASKANINLGLIKDNFDYFIKKKEVYFFRFFLSLFYFIFFLLELSMLIFLKLFVKGKICETKKLLIYDTQSHFNCIRNRVENGDSIINPFRKRFLILDFSLRILVYQHLINLKFVFEKMPSFISHKSRLIFLIKLFCSSKLIATIYKWKFNELILGADDNWRFGSFIIASKLKNIKSSTYQHGLIINKLRYIPISDLFYTWSSNSKKEILNILEKKVIVEKWNGYKINNIIMNPNAGKAVFLTKFPKNKFHNFLSKYENQFDFIFIHPLQLSDENNNKLCVFSHTLQYEFSSLVTVDSSICVDFYFSNIPFESWVTNKEINRILSSEINIKSKFV